MYDICLCTYLFIIVFIAVFASYEENMHLSNDVSPGDIISGSDTGTNLCFDNNKNIFIYNYYAAKGT